MIYKSTLKNVTSSMVLALLPTLSTQASSEQTNQVLKIAQDKRLEASICTDSMNRIAVSNDRITQIFGDEGTFESQNDEATGQVFLKPTAENGSKNLSLTLITEQGITQDLILMPTAQSAKTLILERSGRVDQSHDQSPLRDGYPQRHSTQISSSHMQESHLGFSKTLPIQEELLTILKQAMTGQLSVDEEETISRSSIEGYTITPSQSWQVGTYSVYALTIENISTTPSVLEEKIFFQPGDLALSFDTSTAQQRILQSQDKATLYVVRYRKADLP